VLLSGGMDSATTLAQAVRETRPVDAVTVVYGQRHLREIRSARKLGHFFRVRRHVVLRIPLGPYLTSSLVDPRRPLPRRGRFGRIPSTYVPARNTVLLALALAYAESRRLGAIYLGVNAVDYSGYPDCRPEFLAAFQRLTRLATRAGVESRRATAIRAPLLRLSKEQIVRRGERLGVPWALTWSCYSGGARPCGTCDACRLRARGFAAAGRSDPLVRRAGGTRYRRRTASP
jgi:7-cyano-7-deazaguanine synthase